MGRRLRVNPITCTGHGLCAELLPEAISLDEWGYPIVGPVPDHLIRLARRAVADCPALALELVRDDSS
ncbi:MAG TPA: ferredoxin [Streptosporangiaceae bacterium]|nr:ferredoxin [Streptosporangiaceae bacterium]